MVVRSKKRLGDLIVESGSISRDSLEIALKEQKTTGEKLGRVLVSLGYITEPQLAGALSLQLNLPMADLDSIQPSADLLRMVPEQLARRRLIFPLGRSNGTLEVAMADPLDLAAIDELASRLSAHVETAVATETQILRSIDSHYGFLSSMDEAMTAAGDGNADGAPFDAGDYDGPAPIARLVERIIHRGVAGRASDIHFEPEDGTLRIRYRIDGVMFAGASPPKRLEPSIISRVKIMAGLNIAETRLPQDGHMTMPLEGKRMEFRVCTFPTVHGESVVIRILNRENALMSLAATGLSGGALDGLTNALANRQGMIIACGPTGSGKTTTLYAALEALSSPDKTIVTIEDPVECRLRYVRQTQVNPKAGLTFALGLRSILRQDPDVIMVGEIRDGETARIATRAALTGHLVLSTMHTGDAVGVIPRLMDLGVEPSMIATTLKGVLAQRLVRRLCLDCRVETRGAGAAAGALSAAAERPAPYRKSGCPACRNSGYYGRVGIFEFMNVDGGLQDMIATRARPGSMRKAALASGALIGMRGDGLEKAGAGLTTVDEVLGATHGS